MKIKRNILISLIIVFFAILLFIPSKVSAINAQQLDAKDGHTDRGKRPNAIASIEDLARLAKTSDEFFSDDMFNFIQKKFTTTREVRPEAYNLVNTYCSDDKHGDTRESYSTARYQITSIIDINLDGNGSCVVHYTGGRSYDLNQVINGTYCRNYFYRVAYEAYLYSRVNVTDSDPASAKNTDKAVGAAKERVQQTLKRGIDNFGAKHGDLRRKILNACELRSTNGFDGTSYADTMATAYDEAVTKGKGLKFKARIIELKSDLTDIKGGQYAQSQIVFRGAVAQKNIKIKKVDADNTSKGLAGAKFKFYNTSVGKWLGSNKVANKNEAGAHQFTTDANGEIAINGATWGQYQTKETKAPANYVATNTGMINISSTTGSASYNYVTNKKATINLGIIKQDATNTNIKLSGAKFTVKNTDKNKWVNAQSGLQDTPYEFTTNSEGKIYIGGVPDGNYKAYETVAPKGYQVTYANGVTLKKNDWTTLNDNPVLVSIEGTVFLDGGVGKTNIRNDMFNNGEGINGVRVVLKKNGNIVSEVCSGYDSDGNSTGANGKYKFNGKNLAIKQNELSQYTIEFEYNGIKYQSVVKNMAEAGSKASENSSGRDTFNNNFSTITAKTQINENNVSSNNANGGSTIDYKYSQYPDEGRYESKVIYGTSKKDGHSKPYSSDYYADDKYHMTSYTTEAGYYLQNQAISNNTISNVNFGLYERDLPDMAIRDQLYTAEVALTRQDYGKTYSHVYKYNRNDNFDIKIRTSDAYNTALIREIYRSDAEYNKQNQGALKVYLTYKINITNQNTQINTTVNNIVNYYDNSLSIVGTGTGATIDQAAGTVTLSGNMQTSGQGVYNTEYNKVNILTNGANEVFVKYEVSQDVLKNMLNGDIKLAANVIEINSTTAKKDNKGYTAIDTNSAVGNADPSKRLQNVEDDLAWAPEVIMKISSDVRTTKGIVFEDATSEKFKEGQERKGDGKYNSPEDKKVSGVSVKLIDVGANKDLGNAAYNYNSSGATEITAVTNNEGEYQLSGFLPGNYIVVYQYGNEQYPVQQYQATIYSQDRENANYKNKDTSWYKKDVDTRYSDAIDVYDNKNEYYKLPNDGSKTRTEIERTWASENDNMQHIKYNTSINNDLKIDAFTPCMDFQYEKDDIFTDNAELDANTNMPYDVNNIDFGIVERARYKVKIDNTINKILLKSAEGNTIKEIVPSANMDISNVKYMPSSGRESKNVGAVKGFVELELDSEILQRTDLYVEYGFNVTNKSELEYNTKDYYRSGIPGSENDKVKVIVSNIINYVDNELTFDTASRMLTDSTAANEQYKWSTINWADTRDWLSEDVRNALKTDANQSKYTTMLIGKGFEQQQLKPTESAQIPVKLLLDKSLTPTQDDMKYSNWAEIVEVTKTWGRELYKSDTSTTFGETLGNFNPEKPNPENPNSDNPGNNKEPDFHYPEDIIIHPPTGAEDNTIRYTIIGITVLVVLAIGITTVIFVIKRRKS